MVKQTEQWEKDNGKFIPYLKIKPVCENMLENDF